MQLYNNIVFLLKVVMVSGILLILSNVYLSMYESGI
jgi:hypothetical protein